MEDLNDALHGAACRLEDRFDALERPLCLLAGRADAGLAVRAGASPSSGHCSRQRERQVR